jgi:hypothetical protein
MYEYIIVGGGIESIVQAFFISQSIVNSKVIFITENKNDFSGESTTWSISNRHVSIFDGINFLSQNHKNNLESSIDNGGWLCKTQNFNEDEILWLNKRKSFCQSPEEVTKINKFFIDFNNKSIKKWSDFIQHNEEIMRGTQINYDVDLHSNIHEIISNKGSFSFDAGKFCINIINYLKNKGVSFFYDTKISDVKFNNEKKIEYLISNKGEFFQAKNYIFCPGAYGGNLFKIFNLSHRINGVLGIWAIIKDVNVKKPFKYHYFENNQLKTCQSYTPIDDNSVIVGTGCAWVGNDFTNICEFQKQTFINNQKKVIQIVFPGKEILICNNNCIRAFSDNNLPIFKTGETVTNGKYIFISGTGTFTTASVFLTAELSFKMINHNS